VFLNRWQTGDGQCPATARLNPTLLAEEPACLGGGRWSGTLPDAEELTGYASDTIVHLVVLEPGVELLQKPYTRS
jgi:hypothetical protein